MTKELLFAAMVGYFAGAFTSAVFLRAMIRGAVSGLERQLTAKFDKRYQLVPQEQR